MTETGPVSCQSTIDTPLDKRVSTVGTVHDHLEVKIIDASTGETVPPGVQGEICTRGYSVMRGYWDDEVKTHEAVDREGWMHTGDLGTMNADGYVNVVGRKKDLVIRGGENISPVEIEEMFSPPRITRRSEEHTSELQSPDHLVCRLLLEKKKKKSS